MTPENPTPVFIEHPDIWEPALISSLANRVDKLSNDEIERK